MNNQFYLILGSNLGDRFQMLLAAEELIISKGIHIIRKSGIYESEPWGFESDQLFLNQVFLIECSLKPNDLLIILLNIEEKLGRKRSFNGYTSRNIDIDILYFNQDVYCDNNLIIPHPRLHLRDFTLRPLCEIAPDYIHPKFRVKNIDLLQNLNDLNPSRRV